MDSRVIASSVIMKKPAPGQQRPNTSEASALYVGSLEKGFRVLAAFDEDHPSLGVTDIAMRSGLDKSAAQRFSNTLHQLGFLDKDPRTRRYKPARRLMELSFTYLRHSALGAVAMPRLIEAGTVYRTTVNLAEWIDTTMIYTFRIPHQKAAYVSTVPGRQVPVFCSSSGLAIMSRLGDAEIADILARSTLMKITPHTVYEPDKIMKAIQLTRQRGFAITYQQLMLREIAVSAPIVDYRGYPIAAVQIPVSTPGWTLADARQKLGPLAVETAAAISGALITSEHQED
jgi:IclR family transcriptional regulator, pca regulon regulatory protein